MTDTQAQFRRLLRVLPLIADDTMRPLDDVSAQTGIDRATLFEDLVAVSERYDLSGEFVQSVQILLERDSVSLFAPSFRRPVRLTVSELHALELGLALLRRERPPDERPPIERVQERLRAVVATTSLRPASDDLYAGDLRSERIAEVLQTVRRAIRAGRKVRLAYQGSAETAPSDRVIHPYGLLFANGDWYAVAHCERAADIRVFRADRIAAASTTPEQFEAPSTFSLGEFVRRHRAIGDRARGKMTVRYSPAIARWIAEREGKELAGDGSLTMEHPVADIGWAVRHVLQYGTEAEVLEPEDVRHAVAAALDRIV
jgi:proteasome accessory factor C